MLLAGTHARRPRSTRPPCSSPSTRCSLACSALGLSHAVRARIGTVPNLSCRGQLAWGIRMRNDCFARIQSAPLP